MEESNITQRQMKQNPEGETDHPSQDDSLRVINANGSEQVVLECGGVRLSLTSGMIPIDRLVGLLQWTLKEVVEKNFSKLKKEGSYVG